jgi:hypothetical protein
MRRRTLLASALPAALGLPAAARKAADAELGRAADALNRSIDRLLALGRADKSSPPVREFLDAEDVLVEALRARGLTAVVAGGRLLADVTALLDSRLQWLPDNAVTALDMKDVAAL